MKEITQSAHWAAINRVVDYINHHLYDALDVDTLSGIAHLSVFHFHRVFKAIVGEPIGAYIVRLRLEGVAQKLQMSNLSLAQVGERTNYQSKHALSKAFKKQFGVNPSVFKSKQALLIKQIQQSECYSYELIPEIRLEGAKRLLYTRIMGKYGNAEPYNDSWNRLLAFVREKNWLTNDCEYIGVSYDNPDITGDERCRFYACITVPENAVSQGEFGIKTIDEGLFAIFKVEMFYKCFTELYNAILFKWLPESGYMLRNRLLFEKYAPNDKSNHYSTLIYIPIKKI